MRVRINKKRGYVGESERVSPTERIRHLSGHGDTEQRGWMRVEFVGSRHVESFFFFLFIHYSCATYVDHDEGREPICTVRLPAAVRV